MDSESITTWGEESTRSKKEGELAEAEKERRETGRRTSPKKKCRTPREGADTAKHREKGVKSKEEKKIKERTWVSSFSSICF
jgi:hypothetical protein